MLRSVAAQVVGRELEVRTTLDEVCVVVLVKTECTLDVLKTRSSEVETTEKSCKLVM